MKGDSYGRPARDPERMVLQAMSGRGCFAVVCPECGAKPRVACRTADGKVCRRHRARVVS